ncbi:MAG: hypothetical protein RR063_11250 [Anaerovoracaceae bacterium]
MPQVKNVEKKIYDVEGFEVTIRFDGKDVRGDASLPTQFAGQRMTKNAASVSNFREKFQRQYPGYNVDVLKGDGMKAAGQTKLSTVRDTYLNEE